MNGIIEVIAVFLGLAVLLILMATPVIAFFKFIDYLDKNWGNEE